MNMKNVSLTENIGLRPKGRPKNKWKDQVQRDMNKIISQPDRRRCGKPKSIWATN